MRGRGGYKEERGSFCPYPVLLPLALSTFCNISTSHSFISLFLSPVQNSTRAPAIGLLNLLCDFFLQARSWQNWVWRRVIPRALSTLSVPGGESARLSTLYRCHSFTDLVNKGIRLIPGICKFLQKLPIVGKQVNEIQGVQWANGLEVKFSNGWNCPWKSFLLLIKGQ